MTQKIILILKAKSHKKLDQAVGEITDIVISTKVKVKVRKRLNKRFIHVIEPYDETLNALMVYDTPKGVDVTVKMGE